MVGIRFYGFVVFVGGTLLGKLALGFYGGGLDGTVLPVTLACGVEAL